jgi:hypothetical protein
MRLVYKTFILSTETPCFEEVLAPPGMEISNRNARAAFTNASRLQGILVPYETMRRLTTIGTFLQLSESFYHFNTARRNCNQAASLNDSTVNIFLKKRKIYYEDDEAAPATHWTRLSNGLQALILMVSDPAFATMCSGGGDVQCTIYIPGQTLYKISTASLRNILTRCISVISHTVYDESLKRDLLDFLAPECRWTMQSVTPGVGGPPDMYLDGHACLLPWEDNSVNLIISIRPELIGYEQQPLVVSLTLQSQLATETEDISPIITDGQTITWTNPVDTILDSMYSRCSEPHERLIRLMTLRIRRGTKHHNNEISFDESRFNIRIGVFQHQNESMCFLTLKLSF